MAGNTVQFGVYQHMADRARLTIKLGNALQMEREYKKIDAKYDGHEEVALAGDIEKLSEKAINVADFISRTEYGLKRINDVRNELISMRANLTSGAYEAFDLNYSTANQYAGTRHLEPESLIANPGNGRGEWSGGVEQVDGSGGVVISVDRKFIGNDYAISLANGDTLTASQKNHAMEGGSNLSLEFSKLTVSSYDSDTKEITIHYDDGSPTGVDYTGTLKRGGGGMLNAWAYNNFATQADKDRAIADIGEAHRRLALAEHSLLSDEAGLESAKITMKAKVDDLNKQYQAVAEENLTAKQAERKAVKARFDFQNNSLTLAQGRATVMIQQLFVNSWSFSKPSMTDIMFKAAGY
jgi:hypothetical protein